MHELSTRLYDAISRVVVARQAGDRAYDMWALSSGLEVLRLLGARLTPVQQGQIDEQYRTAGHRAATLWAQIEKGGEPGRLVRLTALALQAARETEAWAEFASKNAG